MWLVLDGQVHFLEEIYYFNRGIKLNVVKFIGYGQIYQKPLELFLTHFSRACTHGIHLVVYLSLLTLEFGLVLVTFLLIIVEERVRYRIK